MSLRNCESRSAFRDRERGQMAVETILVMPIFIMLFFAVGFFGKYSLQKEKLNMAARYAIWKVRQQQTFALPECYSEIEVTVKPSGIGELLPTEIETEGSDALILKLFHALANTANDTKCIEVSSSVRIPEVLDLGTIREIEIRERLVIDGSTWKISDIIALLKNVFRIRSHYFKHD